MKKYYVSKKDMARDLSREYAYRFGSARTKLAKLDIKTVTLPLYARVNGMRVELGEVEVLVAPDFQTLVGDRKRPKPLKNIPR